MDKYDFKELEEKEDLEKQMEEYLLAAIRLISRDSRKRRYAHVEDAQSYISEHYQNPDLSLQEVSEYVGITSSYMSVLFAEVTGKRFSEYLSSYRVSMAKEKMNLNFQPGIALKASRAGNLHVIGTLNLCFSHTHIMFFRKFKSCL